MTPAPPNWAELVKGCPAAASKTARELADVFAAARASVRRLAPVDSMERRGSISAIDEAEELAVLAATRAVELEAQNVELENRLALHDPGTQARIDAKRRATE